MSDAWVLRDNNRDTERELDSRSAAEDAREDLVGIGANRDDLEIIPPGGTSEDGDTESLASTEPPEERWCEACDETTTHICDHNGRWQCRECDTFHDDGASDGSVGVDMDDDATVVEDTNGTAHVEASMDDRGNPALETIPEQKPTVDEDPVDWLPGHFVDKISGSPVVNRKGYAVLASQYGVSVTAEPVVRASETGFEHAEFKAVATTKDGETYSGFGSAHVDRADGDDPYLLNELAETRAMKRACAWSTGIGMTAIEELQNKP